MKSVGPLRVFLRFRFEYCIQQVNQTRFSLLTQVVTFHFLQFYYDRYVYTLHSKEETGFSFHTLNFFCKFLGIIFVKGVVNGMSEQIQVLSNKLFQKLSSLYRYCENLYKLNLAEFQSLLLIRFTVHYENCPKNCPSLTML